MLQERDQPRPVQCSAVQCAAQLRAQALPGKHLTQTPKYAGSGHGGAVSGAIAASTPLQIALNRGVHAHYSPYTSLVATIAASVICISCHMKSTALIDFDIRLNQQLTISVSL